MLRKAVLLAVSLALFTVFNAILIIAPSDQPACCTNPEVPSFCLDEAFPGTPNLYADINDCCFGDQDCADQYLKLDTSCNTLLECTTGAVVGCCIDECKSGTQAQCKNKVIDNFKAVSCDNIASCSTGCCLCTDAQALDGTPGEQKLAFNLITEPECISDCQDRGYASYLFNPQQDDCRIGVKLQGVKVSGLVTDISGNPLEKATVIIQGIGQLETLSGGEYEIEDVPPGQYIIKVIKSQYLTNITTFTIAVGTTDKTINFNLRQAAFGTISGKVTDDGPSLKEIPNAVIKVTGLDTDNDYLSDQQGNYALLFHLLAQEKDYNIEASAQGYFSKTETAKLSAGNDNVALDFHLTKKQKGILKVLVLNSIDQITPIQGARVTLGTGLQRFTDFRGEVIFGGEGRLIDNIYQGNYTVTIFKPLFLTNSTHLFEVRPNFENVLTVYLEQDNDMCYLPADSGRGIFEEYIRNDSCSQLNKPYYCMKGDLRGRINELQYNNCQGKDGTARTADDCCPANQECQDNGFCLPKDVECTSTCTFKNDLTCRAVCNGTAGCLFYNQQVKLDCDGKSAINTILSGSKYGLAADQSIVCCAGIPRSSKKEDCLTPEDDDENGKINCADPDCYQKSCHRTDKSKICQPDRDGKLTEKGCRAKLCSSGEITSANAGCECVPFSGITAQVGNYCCALDKTLYQDSNAKADFITTSPCGNTPCRLAKPIQGTCCRACRETGTNIPASLLRLGNNACNYQGIKCCKECDITSDFTCAYRSQCPDYALLTGDRTQQTNVLCAVACEDIKSCAENTPIFDMNLNRPLCKCNEETYLVPSLESSGKYCCKADNKIYVSNLECPGAPELGKITGKVTDSVTGNPILGASICTGPTTCYGVTNNDGKYEIRIRFDTEYTFYAIKPGYTDSAKLDPSAVNEFQVRSKLKVTKDSDASRIKENQDFKLTEEKDVCAQDLPPVKFFTVNHTLGDVKKIQLKWGKPDCPRIMGFEIIKTLVPTQTTTTTTISAQPPPLPFMEPNKNSFVDSEVDYDKTYEYEINVKYLPTGLKSQANTSRITVGQLQCEGMYRNNQHVQFCAVNSANKLVDKKICNKENRIKKDNNGVEQVIGSCDPNTQVCSGPNAAGLAVCKKMTECGTRKQDAFPFGLYFQKEKCLGVDSAGDVDNSNNCYYDYYKSDENDPNKVHGIIEGFGTERIVHRVTPFNKCINCPTTKASKMSCFNYRSEYACATDNCNLGSKDASLDNGVCRWINASYSELGFGYCYVENYSKNDRCNLCSDTNDVFFNTRCSQDICGRLGKCFSADYEASCKKCTEDTKCEEFRTKKLCVAGNDEYAISIADDATVNYSKDICSLGRCKWDSTFKRCYKDGDDDANSLDDCSPEELRKIDPSLTRLTEECKKDNNATVTRLMQPRGLSSIGGGKIGGANGEDELLFSIGQGEKYAYTFSYCIDKEDIGPDGVNKGNKCYPGANTPGGGQIAYGTSAEVRIKRNDIKRSLEIQGYTQSAQAGIYYIRFFSTDKFYNQEEVKSVPVHIDIWPPILSSSYIPNINMEGIAVNKDTKSQLLFTIASDEDVHCTFEELKPKGIGSIDNSKSIKIQTKNDKGENYYAKEFKPEYVVKDGLYSYKVTCSDKSLNRAEILYDGSTAIHVDAFSKATILEPVSKKIFNDNNIQFKVKTDDPSICKLMQLPSLTLATGSNPEFTPDANKLQHTLSFPVSVVNTDYVSGRPFSSQHYPDIAGSGYGVKCTHILGEVEDVEAFEFTVDRTPPNVILVVANRNNGAIDFNYIMDNQFFEEYGDDVGLSILCQDTPISESLQVFGAKPNSGKICLTDGLTGCDKLQTDNFVPANTVNLLNSTKHLCFTCEDIGGNIAPLKCGDIIVDKEWPEFTLTVYDENNLAVTDDDIAVTTLVRKMPAKFYRAEIISTEELKEDAVLSFRIKRHDSDTVVDYKTSLRIQKKTNQLINPLQVYYETLFAVPIAEEFNDLDNRDTVELIISGKDRFDNQGSLTENYIVDSTLPKPPILNEFEQKSTRYSAASLFEQTGFEGDKIADRNITVEFGNRPNLIRTKILNINGVTLTTTADLSQQRVQQSESTTQSIADQQQTQPAPQIPTQQPTPSPQSAISSTLSRKTLSTYSTPDPGLIRTIKLEAVLEGDKLKVKDVPADIDLATYYLEFENLTLPTKRFYEIKNVLDTLQIDAIQTNIIKRLEAKAAKEQGKKLKDDEDKKDKESSGISVGGAVLDFITGRAFDDTTTTSDSSTSSTTSGYTLSSPALIAATQQEPNSKFISLGRTLYGLEDVKEEDLDAQSTYKRDLVLNVYERASPTGWFNVNMQLQEGSTWFYAYAVDENTNIGLPTSVKKVIIDTQAPNITHYGPADNSKISANLGAKIFATFTDFNSGIIRETAVLEFDNQRYTCESTGVECLGTKTFTISLVLPLKQQGQYTVKASVADALGNRKEHSWQFVINNNAPSQIKPEALSGFCPANNKCYVNNKQPEFILKYDTLPAVEISAVFKSDPIQALVEKISNYVKLKPVQEVVEDEHTIDVLHKDAGTGNTIVEYPNFVKFVVDTKYPDIAIDNITPTSSKSINIAGVYTEDNVDEIRFSGDILVTEPLTYRELPTDIIDGGTYFFIKDVELDISNVSKPGKEIRIRIIDKANNSKEITIIVYYDISPPGLANVTVQTISSGKKIFEFNRTSYKTNDLKIKISGISSKPLFNMILATEYVTKLVNIDPDRQKFNVELDLYNTLTQTKAEHVLLQAEDLAGNKQFYFLLIELDIHKPEVEVKII